MACDRQCAAEARRSQLADAFGLPAGSAGGPHVSSFERHRTPTYPPALLLVRRRATRYSTVYIIYKMLYILVNVRRRATRAASAQVPPCAGGPALGPSPQRPRRLASRTPRAVSGLP
jgi:hypothetical protein